MACRDGTEPRPLWPAACEALALQPRTFVAAGSPTEPPRKRRRQPLGPVTLHFPGPSARRPAPRSPRHAEALLPAAARGAPEVSTGRDPVGLGPRSGGAAEPLEAPRPCAGAGQRPGNRWPRGQRHGRRGAKTSAVLSEDRCTRFKEYF